MADPLSERWLTIIGIGENGTDGLIGAARAALADAELVMGPPRHLSLLGPLNCPTIEWPVPFIDGIARLLDHRGRRVVVLASGDPFWFGAGSSISRHLERGEWTVHAAPSTFTLAAGQLGWAIQDCACLGLHAAPIGQLRRHLVPGRRIIALLRDGPAVRDLADYLVARGFGQSMLHVMEALGGPRARLRGTRAEDYGLDDVTHPVAVGLAVEGDGRVMPVASGLPDDLFESDGQMTKHPVRALTLSALAPRPGETLWDIGAGSGSIGIEWLLAHPANAATAVEADPVRAARAAANAAALGVERLRVIEGRAPDCLPESPLPDAVFIGGGLSAPLLEALWARFPAGTRLVANAVTLESESLLARWHGSKGGTLLRIALADASPIGSRHGWKARYPVVQWSVTL
ncbi:MAG: precorrin-6y C5,15-methyltransferase (decarboxylating) subunit CbiE [Novosphingobium sp.]